MSKTFRTPEIDAVIASYPDGRWEASLVEAHVELDGLKVEVRDLKGEGATEEQAKAALVEAFKRKVEGALKALTGEDWTWAPSS